MSVDNRLLLLFKPQMDMDLGNRPILSTPKKWKIQGLN